MKSFLFLVFLLTSRALVSQALPDLIPYLEGKKWGYCDSTGKVIIQPQWQSAGLFHGNYAIISTNYRFGLIDKTGNVLIEPQYGYMEREKNYFVVQDDTKRMFINEKNERVDDFEDPVYAKIITQLNRRYGRNVTNVIRLSGDYYQASYDTTYISQDHMGDHYFEREMKESVYFLCNEKGEKLSAPSFGSIKMLCPDLYYVGNRNDSRIVTAKGLVLNKIKSMSGVECGLYRFKDETNTYLLDSSKCELFMCPTNFLEVGSFKNNYAHARLNTPGNYQEQLVDRSGNTFTKAYHFIGDYSEGLAMFQESNSQCGYIDEKGNELIAPKFTRAFDFKEGLALVEKKGDFFYIDQEGKKALDIPYEFERSIQAGDRAGRMNIPEGDFYGFSNGMALIEKNGRFGYIDKTGKEIVSPIYHYAEPFVNGTAVVYELSDTVKKLYTHFLIDVTGKKVHEFAYRYDAQTITQYAAGFNQSASMKTKRWRGLYDRNNWIIFDTRAKRVTTSPITSLYNENISGGKLIKVYLGQVKDVTYLNLEGKLFFKE